MALKGSEVAEHNSAKSCWVIIHVSKMTQKTNELLLTISYRARHMT